MIQTEGRERINGSLCYGPSYRDRKKRHNSNEATTSRGCLWRSATFFSWRNDCKGTSTGTGQGPADSKRARVSAFTGTHAGGSTVGISASTRNAGGAAGK